MKCKYIDDINLNQWMKCKCVSQRWFFVTKEKDPSRSSASDTQKKSWHNRLTKNSPLSFILPYPNVSFPIDSPMVYIFNSGLILSTHWAHSPLVSNNIPKNFQKHKFSRRCFLTQTIMVRGDTHLQWSIMNKQMIICHSKRCINDNVPFVNVSHCRNQKLTQKNHENKLKQAARKLMQRRIEQGGWKPC